MEVNMHVFSLTRTGTTYRFNLVTLYLTYDRLTVVYIIFLWYFHSNDFCKMP